MSQLRLTVKMTKELKIAELGFPSDNYPKLYDDWYWDITRILRRKVVSVRGTRPCYLIHSSLTFQGRRSSMRLAL